MTIYDITIPMQTSLAVWPGDTPYAFSWSSRKCDGESVNIGAVAMSVHTGTHADAHYHFLDTGATIDQSDLDVYIGPAVVVDLTQRPGMDRPEDGNIDGIHLSDIEHLQSDPCPRVLFKTCAWTDFTCFPQSIPVMDADVPAFLRELGVVLIGVDVPSVDALDSKDLPIHHELARCGIQIIESLDLRAVSAGRYELLALPLKLLDADGAPVRAVLRS